MSPEEVADTPALRRELACAISVWTEPTHFMGSLDNVEIARETGLPSSESIFISTTSAREVQADLVLLIVLWTSI